MRYLIRIILTLLIFGCKNTIDEHTVIGTWSKCTKDGRYFEYKITNEYIMMLSSQTEEIYFFRNELTDKGLIISEFENGDNLMINNDTLIIVSESKNKFVLKSTYTYDTYEFNEADFEIDNIDSLNLDFWKNKTLSKLNERAELANCQDLRTEDEKKIGTLELDDQIEEELIITEIKND